jgi:penicillin amidase
VRFLFRFLVLVIVGAALTAGAGYVYLRRSLPVVEGEISLTGLTGPVEILRDRFAIPHIFAAAPEDASFALGFAHAQDRLWQMEMNRRIAAGRLAEVVGPPGLETDRFMRTLGVRRVAEANLRRLDAETLGHLEAYAAGVNAFIASGAVLPPEFWILRVTPEPWMPADSVAWMKMMAWDLGGNWRSELLRLQLARRVPTARIQEFLAPYPGDAPVELPDLKKFYEGLEKKGTGVATKIGSDPISKAEMGSDPNFGGASNSWVVSGARSATGKPLLANDPHLGLTAPPVWYFAHLEAPGFSVIGATLPGVPGVIVGRNDRIAWGFTNTGPDVQDLYIERLDSKFTQIEELIKVKGAPDEKLVVRLSRHGPVISDVSRAALAAVPRGHALAMAWTALAEDDLTMQAGVRMQRARNWQEFLAALRHLHTPQQNVTYADVDGNIGFVAAGRVPIRKLANDLKGLAPAPGWDLRYDWAGWVPFDELPRAFNPPSGSIVTANHKIVPQGYPHWITSEWQPPYRARRIEALLQQTRKHDAASFGRIHADVVSLAMRELLPFFRSTQPNDEKAAQAIKLLSAWDGSMAADRPEPLIAAAWWRELARALYADELGDAFRTNWLTRAVFMGNVLANRGGQARWCDDLRTRRAESCGELLSASLDKALADLSRRHGDDMALWRWGEAHAAQHRHRPFSRNALLASWFDINVPTPGDAYTVNVGRSDFNDEQAPYANRHAASLRAIYDLADLQRSLFIHSGGQSGNPLSRHYRAFAEAWARVEYIPMLSERRRLEADGVQRLVLAPRK